MTGPPILRPMTAITSQDEKKRKDEDTDVSNLCNGQHAILPPAEPGLIPPARSAE